MEKFVISANLFLKKNTFAFYHQPYTGFGNDDNPEFINTIKNNFNGASVKELEEAKATIKDIILNDMHTLYETIGKKTQFHDWLLVCVPRSRAEQALFPKQKLFREAISEAACDLPSIEDGTQAIIRHTTVRTTHIKKPDIVFKGADGKEIKNDECKHPYPGMIKDTCTIDRNMIKDKNIILIDDVYTKSANIDEDCIQALYDNGAKYVVFYAIAYTQRG